MTGNLGQVPCCDLSCQSWPRTFFITWRLGVREQSYPRPLYAWLLTLSFFRCSMNTWHQIKISLEDQKKNPSWQNTCKLTSSVRTGAPPSPPLIPQDWLLCVWLGFTWKGSLTYVFQRNKKEPCTEGIGPGCHPALCQCILGLGTSSEAPVHNLYMALQGSQEICSNRVRWRQPRTSWASATGASSSCLKFAYSGWCW